jgi:hypothetical protein
MYFRAELSHCFYSFSSCDTVQIFLDLLNPNSLNTKHDTRGAVWSDPIANTCKSRESCSPTRITGSRALAVRPCIDPLSSLARMSFVRLRRARARGSASGAFPVAKHLAPSRADFSDLVQGRSVCRQKRCMRGLVAEPRAWLFLSRSRSCWSLPCWFYLLRHKCCAVRGVAVEIEGVFGCSC